MITAKKKQYIITNHYDMCAISSSNVKVAVAVAYVLGQGRFGLKEASTGKIVLFPHQNPLQVIHIKTEKDINAFFDKHSEAVAECFESTRCPSGRKPRTYTNGGDAACPKVWSIRKDIMPV